MKAVVLGTMNPETGEDVELTVEKISNSFVVIQLKQKRLPVLRARVNVKEFTQILSFLVEKSIYLNA